MCDVLCTACELCCELGGGAGLLRGTWQRKNLQAEVGLAKVRTGAVGVVVCNLGIECKRCAALKRGRGDPVSGHRGERESVVSSVKVRPHSGRLAGHGGHPV